MAVDKIRNFSIIAHVDHGKSTLADRFLELTHTLPPGRKVSSQFLDNMELEQERGITIKAQTVRMQYKAQDGQLYQFNLIDTPGHVDFSYEVSRSLSACEGAILVVDATQGVEAQTIANTYLALDNKLRILPVLNKIDLPNADPDRCRKQIQEILGLDPREILTVSAKTGEGVPALLEAVVTQLPPPKGSENQPLKALLFDSWFDIYKGVIILVRIFDGTIQKGTRIKLMSSGKEFEILDLGVFAPLQKPVDALYPGEVGFIAAGIKEVRDTKIGDTITYAEEGITQPLPGFVDVKPMVFCGVFPQEPNQYPILKEALEKLRLNDSSFSYEGETSTALGFGFRCGFLGLLHMEIIQERLEREYNLQLVTTAPSVAYRLLLTNGSELMLDNPAKMPQVSEIEQIQEPYILGSVYLPPEYLGHVLKLCENRRGIQKSIEYLTSNRILLQYELPLAEMVFDFYDRLKSASKGYATFDYDFIDFRPSELVRLDILINGESVDALSLIVHKEKAYYRGRELAKKMRELIPRQLYEVAIQAAIGSRIIARETVSAMRKDVTAKCYGGDITRKRKLLEKQKEGKKRLKRVGKVEIPQEVFLSVLKID